MSGTPVSTPPAGRRRSPRGRAGTRPAAAAVRLPLAAAPVISYADRYGFLPLVAVAASELRIPEHAVTAAVSAYFLLYGLAQPVIGVLSDRFGRVAVLRWALAGLALADLAAALATGAGELIAARAAAGAASGALLPTALVYLGDTVEFEHRQRAVGKVLAAAAVGAAVSMAAAGLLGRWASWQVPLVMIAVFAVAATAGLHFLPEPPKEAARPSIRKALRRSPALLPLLIFAVFEGAAVLGFFTFFAPALQARGISSAAAGLVVSAYGIAIVGGSWLLNRLPSRAVTWVPVTTGGAAMVAGYLTAALAQTMWTILAASALLGLAYSLFHSTFQTWATQVLPAARGLATSLYVTCLFAGAAAGSAWASELQSSHGYGAMFAVSAAVAAAVSVTGIIAQIRRRPATG